MAFNIPTVPLGKNGPKIPQLGIGLMGLSSFYGPTKPDEERLKFLDDVYAAGERFWDSADMYGDSEDLLGKWFKRSGKRDEIFLATKFANVTLPDGTRTVRNDPEYVEEAVNKSLERLGVDTIDLYYCHRMQKDQPVEITVKAMKKLKDEGKVKYLGLSECSADTIRRACAVVHIDAVQLEYSPWALEVEQFDILKTARELGVAVVSYSPLGRGFLTGRFQSPSDFPKGDFRTFAPRFSSENFHKNLELVNSITEIAKKKGCTPGQLTLAWLMAQGPDILPIPGTTSIDNLKENLGAVNVRLTPEEISEVRKLVESTKAVGGRYPESFAQTLLSDTVPLKA